MDNSDGHGESMILKILPNLDHEYDVSSLAKKKERKKEKGGLTKNASGCGQPSGCGLTCGGKGEPPLNNPGYKPIHHTVVVSVCLKTFR